MPAKRPTGARSETVQCESCGEHYAVTYKRCPFCDGKPSRRRAEEYDDEPTRIFRRPRAEEEYDEVPVRRARQTGEEEPAPVSSRRRARDEYEPDEEYDDDVYDDDDDDSPPPRGDGGRRLVTNERGGGYRRRGPSVGQIIVGILSVALVASAIYIVVLLVSSILDKNPPIPPSSSTPPTHSLSPAPSGTSTAEPSPSPAETSAPPAVSPSAEPTGSAIPSGQTATAFTLTDRAGARKQDITLSDQYPDFKFVVAFSPNGSKGTVTWSSSKPQVVSVDASGKVVGLSKGVATITATMAGGYEQQCMVRSTVSSGSAQPAPSPSAAPSASASPSPSSGGALSFNVASKDEFTLTGKGDSWTLKVKNAVGTPTWSIKDASIATIDAAGKVTAVSKGSTTITAAVDGQTLTCRVHVNIP